MLEKAKKLIAPAITGIIAMSIPTGVFAATANSIVPTSLNSVSNIDVVQIIRAIIQFILIVAFVLAFIFLLIGGIRWITAGGDEKGVEKARGMITAALIGLVVVLIAFALIKLVETFFGVSIIDNICIPNVNVPVC